MRPFTVKLVGCSMVGSVQWFYLGRGAVGSYAAGEGKGECERAHG
jgi:hypothetical protein